MEKEKDICFGIAVEKEKRQDTKMLKAKKNKNFGKLWTMNKESFYTSSSSMIIKLNLNKMLKSLLLPLISAATSPSLSRHI